MKMKKANLFLVFVLLTLVLFIFGCAVEEPATVPVVEESATDISTDLEEDLSALDTLDEDLDLSELDSLEQELADLENLEFE
jgi:hypothetical protein